ncbi:MAG: hypothetical protein ACI8UR_002426 [Natronomonas sp.]|jgi:uncharacterized protein YggE|uniref:SIMPL domain-containing protein n=1 Tax=Natronomonas sp. TaxID=2184060 RepID=UPI0039894C39
MSRDKLSILVVVTALLAVAMVGAALVAPIGAEDPDANSNRTITVDATGDASAAPDKAVVRVAVTATGDNASAVRNDLAAGADSLRANLADANVSEDAYKTSNYRIREPRRRSERGDAPAYRGAHVFEITLDDPETVGTVIDAATNAGAETQHVEFTLSEERRKELRQRAIENSLNDARTQADKIAATTNLEVTGVTTVDATERSYRPVRYEAAAVATDSASTSVEAGDVSVSYQVRVTYNATHK